MNKPSLTGKSRFHQGKYKPKNPHKYLGNPTNTNPKYDDGRQGAEYRSDENSLIEGKYFVARMYFDQRCDFKIDTISFNYKNKL